MVQGVARHRQWWFPDDGLKVTVRRNNATSWNPCWRSRAGSATVYWRGKQLERTQQFPVGQATGERSVSCPSGRSEEEHRRPALWSCLPLGKLFNLSLPLLPHLENEGNNACFIRYSPQSKGT